MSRNPVLGSACCVSSAVGLVLLRKHAFIRFAQSHVWAGCDQGQLCDSSLAGEGGHCFFLQTFPRLSSSGSRQLRVSCSYFSQTNEELRCCQHLSWRSDFIWPDWDSGATPLFLRLQLLVLGEQHTPSASKQLFDGTIGSPFANPPGPDILLVLSPPPAFEVLSQYILRKKIK